MDLNEIEKNIAETLTKRGKREEGEQKIQFELNLKSLKDNFNMEISTEYLRNLLVFYGKTDLQATKTISNFIKKNEIPIKDTLIISKLRRKYLPYGEEIGWYSKDYTDRHFDFL